MLNFTIGPVQAGAETLELGGCQVPYFRTAEFSAVMLESERLLKKLAGADENGRAVFLTGSGTAAMEAAILNCFSDRDRLLVVNGGSFGQRFADLCRLHGIPHTELCPPAGGALTAELLAPCEGEAYTGFVVNVHETSTGVLYDMALISAFCRRNGLFLVADAISSFLADPFDMQSWGVDVMLTASQKALACPPGVSMAVLSPRAVERVRRGRTSCMYLDWNAALQDGARGQTPFTPAVGILLQIHRRLRQIDAAGGAAREIQKTSDLARDFRDGLEGLPLEIASESLSNAVTPLHPLRVSAYSVFETLKDEYGIWICPNGGALRDRIFRVGHIGALTRDDNARLLAALRDLHRRQRL